jgi:hypothetical protein
VPLHGKLVVRTTALEIVNVMSRHAKNCHRPLHLLAENLNVIMGPVQGESQYPHMSTVPPTELVYPATTSQFHVVGVSPNKEHSISCP